jgi:hypothetical protein
MRLCMHGMGFRRGIYASDTRLECHMRGYRVAAQIQGRPLSGDPVTMADGAWVDGVWVVEVVA